MDVKGLLVEEIKTQITQLEDLEVGSDEHRKGVEDVSKLLTQYNEMERNEFERLDKIESREKEIDLKLKQLKEDKKDHIIKNCLTAVSVVGGMALTVWGTYKSIKFEETGTITTIMGRGFINKLLPKK